MAIFHKNSIESITSIRNLEHKSLNSFGNAKSIKSLRKHEPKILIAKRLRQSILRKSHGDAVKDFQTNRNAIILKVNLASSVNSFKIPLYFPFSR